MNRLWLVGIAVFLIVASAFAVSAGSEKEEKLNLSHVYCVDGKVEVHFVLLDVPDGVIPSNLDYTYGTGIVSNKNVGNVWHYTDYLPDGYYDIDWATVTVGDHVVTLHNPHEYAGDYACNVVDTPTPTKTMTSTSTPTSTFTPTPTKTATEERHFDPTKTLTPTRKYVTITPTKTYTPTPTIECCDCCCEEEVKELSRIATSLERIADILDKLLLEK